MRGSLIAGTGSGVGKTTVTLAIMIRGHSFHYLRLVDTSVLPTSYNVRYSLSGRQEAEGFIRGNTLASYVHLHVRAVPHVVRNFVTLTRTVKTRELVTT